MADEKQQAIMHDSVSSVNTDQAKPAISDVVEDVKGRDFTVDQNDVPQGYFRSASFLGSMFAIGSAFGCGVAGFTFAAPILSYINADIGPSILTLALVR